MSSSQKTEYLGLNSWLGTDRPQRIDFVDDNARIDSALKSHITNSTAHCTSTEKSRYDNPFTFTSYVGTGSATRTLTLSFSPKLVIIFTKDAPVIETDNSGASLTNFAVVAKSNGNTGGAAMVDNVITVNQSTTAVNGVKHNLNKLNGQYCIIAFK